MTLPSLRLQPTAVLAPGKRWVLAMLPRHSSGCALLRSSRFAGLLPSAALDGSPSLRRRDEEQAFSATNKEQGEVKLAFIWYNGRTTMNNTPVPVDIRSISN